MAIAFRSVTSGADEAPAEPSGAAEFDILLAVASCEESADATVTPATGWAQVTGLFDEGTGTGQQLMGGVYWIRRGSSPVANNWTIGGSGGGGRIISVAAYSGAKRTGNPWNGTPVLTLNASDATYGSITTSVDDCMCVALQTCYFWALGVTGTGGWNERLDQQGTGPEVIYDQLMGAAGASPALTVAGDGAVIAMLLALEPEPATPAAPTITAQGGGHTRAGVEWTAGSDGGSAVTDWDIDHATAAAPTTWLGPTATGSTFPYGAVTGLTNGVAYVFRVRGVNAAGDGAWSSTSSSATPADVRGFFLLEDGTSKFLLENGTDKFLLEAGAGSGVSLVVADATHAHTAANTVLTQHQVLTVAAATQAHTAANAVLTQHQLLTVANATHGHTAANAVLVQHQVLVVADATHGHTAAATVLTQHQVLVVASATHAHTAAAVVLTQHQVLTVAGATHGHTVENLTLTANGPPPLVVQDAGHGHTAGAVVLTQHHILTVANAGHGHSAAAVALVQHQVLTVADATHGHTVESVVVDAHGPGVVTLVVANATHAHTAAAVTLTQHHLLTVAGATHGHSAAAVVLTQHHTLTVAGSTHAHSAANVTLTIGVATLVVANSGHGHSVANVTLTQHNVLELADATHAHTVVNVALLQHFVLTVAGAVHAHLGAVVMFVIPDVGGTATGGIVWRDAATATVTVKADAAAGVAGRDTATATVTARDGQLATVGAAHTATGEVGQP